MPISDEQKECILDILTNHCSKDDSGMFYSEIYADCQAELCDTTILKICRSENPRDAFYETMDEIFMDADWPYERDLVDQFRERETIQAAIESGTVTDDELLEFLRDIHYVKTPLDHYLKQDVSVDILLDTGDANYDFTLNQPFACWYGKDDKVIDECSALLWLTRQQGYKKSNLNQALRDRKFNDSAFLKSVYQEVSNTSTHMNTVTFLIKIELQEYFKLHDSIRLEAQKNRSSHPSMRKGRGYLTLDKNTTCGLYDPWNGAGGLLEIKLEKDVRLPIRLIDSAKPDGCRGYSVAEIWGVCSSEWTDNAVKGIHPQTSVA